MGESPNWPLRNLGARMSDTEYLEARAAEELVAAIATKDSRIRLRHLELADAYAFRLREVRAAEARGKLKLVTTE